ncbi:MAG TPA: hypothetical protein DIT39_07790 [Tissierellales bacterium]|jgi:beta-phosphoglucomutase-like phosphatase (HAD superfamily)|nr:hypothetical protein [Tissierellales bacterium]
MIKAVIFGLDGALIDTKDLIVDTFYHVINELLGTSPTIEELNHVYGMDLLLFHAFHHDDKIITGFVHIAYVLFAEVDSV